MHTHAHIALSYLQQVHHAVHLQTLQPRHCEFCAARWKVPVLTAKSQVMQYSSCDKVTRYHRVPSQILSHSLGSLGWAQQVPQLDGHAIL